MHLQLHSPHQQEIDEIATLKSLIELHICSSKEKSIALPIFNDLQKISINESSMKETSLILLLMFISRTVNLIKIKINHFYFHNSYQKIIDFVALNKQRQQLNEAEKFTFYAAEPVQLSTK